MSFRKPPYIRHELRWLVSIVNTSFMNNFTKLTFSIIELYLLRCKDTNFYLAMQVI